MNERYLQREETRVGRIINNVLDAGDRLLVLAGGALSGHLSDARDALNEKTEEKQALRQERVNAESYLAVEKDARIWKDDKSEDWTPEVIAAHDEWELERQAVEDKLDREQEYYLDPDAILDLRENRINDLHDRIVERLEAAQVSEQAMGAVLETLDNAAIYSHGSDPHNRLAQTPDEWSIAAEWEKTGITDEQANAMLDATVALHQERIDQFLAHEALGRQQEEAYQREMGHYDHSQQNTQHDYAEAYADAAGDATLIGRFHDGEDPVVILESVRQQVREEMQRASQQRVDTGKPSQSRADALER